MNHFRNKVVSGCFPLFGLVVYYSTLLYSTVPYSGLAQVGIVQYLVTVLRPRGKACWPSDTATVPSQSLYCKRHGLNFTYVNSCVADSLFVVTMAAATILASILIYFMLSQANGATFKDKEKVTIISIHHISVLFAIQLIDFDSIQHY